MHLTVTLHALKHEAPYCLTNTLCPVLMWRSVVIRLFSSVEHSGSPQVLYLVNLLCGTENHSEHIIHRLAVCLLNLIAFASFEHIRVQYLTGFLPLLWAGAKNTIEQCSQVYSFPGLQRLPTSTRIAPSTSFAR